MNKEINWISVKDKPLIHISPTGTKYPTEAGKGRFICAIPHVDMHTGKPFFIIALITLFDDCSICEIGSEDEKWYNEDGIQCSSWTTSAEEITHYIPESQLELSLLNIQTNSLP